MPIEHQIQTARPGQASQPRQAGFTLVELMVVVAVIGVLAVVAAPAMSELVAANRANGAAGELTSALQVARSEAIRRNNRVSVCVPDGAPSNTTGCSASGTWSTWAVLDLTKNNVGERVIRYETPSDSLQISGPAGGIVFRPSGVIDAQTTVCAKKSSHERQLTVLISGVISTQKVCN